MSEDKSPAKLVVETGIENQNRLCFEIILPRCIVGSQNGSDILLDNPLVSRRHAEVFANAEHYLIRDLGSTNGTFVDGERIGEDFHPLRNKARLDFGGSPYGRRHVIVTFFEPGSTLVNDEMHDLVVDTQFREVRVLGQVVEDITPIEYRVLAFLYLHRGKVCNFQQLLEAGWPHRKNDPDNLGSNHDVEQITKRLRRKIGRYAPDHQFLVNVRGVGYRLVARPLATEMRK